MDVKCGVSTVVKIAVKAKDDQKLPKLVDDLQKLSRSDPLVVRTTEGRNEHVIVGCGELHVEICLKDLHEEYAQCDFMMSDPVVSYCETVNEVFSQTCLTKSLNEHDCIYLTAELTFNEIRKEIEDGELGSKVEAKKWTRTLREKFEWDRA